MASSLKSQTGLLTKEIWGGGFKWQRLAAALVNGRCVMRKMGRAQNNHAVKPSGLVGLKDSPSSSWAAWNHGTLSVYYEGLLMCSHGTIGHNKTFPALRRNAYLYGPLL
jgi:hypothetical protein